MHEMSICESIVQTMKDLARTGGFRRVDAVWLEIGPLAGVELEALRFGFDLVTRGTLAEGARLEVVQPAADAWCTECMRTVPIRVRYDPCPDCGRYGLLVTSGDQMRIKELEVS